MNLRIVAAVLLPCVLAASCGAVPERRDPTPGAQRLQWALQGAAAGAAAASVTCETADQGCYSGVSWPTALIAVVLTGAALAVEASTLPPAAPGRAGSFVSQFLPSPCSQLAALERVRARR